MLRVSGVASGYGIVLRVERNFAVLFHATRKRDYHRNSAISFGIRLIFRLDFRELSNHAEFWVRCKSCILVICGEDSNESSGATAW